MSTSKSNKYLQIIEEFYETSKSDVTVSDIIELISGYTIIPFDKNDPKELELLDIFKKSAACAVQNIQREKIVATRPNEVGNKIEPFIMDAIIKQGYNAQIPYTSTGHLKSSGYPDISVTDGDGKIIAYIECKTYNNKNKDTSLRSFYLSPSDNFKVTANAHHFIISLCMAQEGNTNTYVAREWIILDIAKLPISLKIEFNSDNKRMYSNSDLLLAESSDHVC